MSETPKSNVTGNARERAYLKIDAMPEGLAKCLVTPIREPGKWACGYFSI